MEFKVPHYLKPKAKILVAMSGGIDSTITAYLLKKAGFDCIGIYMQYWTDPKYIPNSNEAEITNKCCNLEDLNNAKAFAHQLDIPFYTLNFREEFKKNVVDEFIEIFSQLKTPNPCVTCNKKIKFGTLIQKMHELKADYVATGHYARILLNQDKFELWEGLDKNKDQSYFLHQLDQATLGHIILPLGEFKKNEVKNLAQKLNLKIFQNKKESQGVCFYPDKNYTDFLKRYLPQKYFTAGKIVDEAGNQLGKHLGLIHYTIGQRKGILVGGQEAPIYVIGFDLKQNHLILGPDTSLWRKEIQTKNNHWIEGNLPKDNQKIEIRIRHLAKKAKAKLSFNFSSNKKEPQGQILLKSPLRAITPGQSAVYYTGEKVLGGGIII